MSKRITKEYFPEIYIQLRREVNKHPVLLASLISVDPTDFTAILAEIGVHCEVMIDGEYSPKDLIRLCEILIQKLQKMRMIEVIADMNLCEDCD